jgi:hypothetical protein
LIFSKNQKEHEKHALCFPQILEKKGCVLNWRNVFFIYQK